MSRASAHLPSHTRKWESSIKALHLQEEHDVFKSELVVTAYCVAARAHLRQLRKDGSSLMSHCMAVAKTLASTGCDEQTVAAGLVHEVLGMHGSSLYQSQLEEFMPTEVRAPGTGRPVFVHHVAELFLHHLGCRGSDTYMCCPASHRCRPSHAMHHICCPALTRPGLRCITR